MSISRLTCHSNILKAFNISKFKQKVVLSTNHCSKHVKRKSVSEDNIAFTINIPLQYLRSWCELKDGEVLQPYSYVQILNAFIRHYRIQIKEDSKRINGLLRRACSEAKCKSRKSTGRLRNVAMEGVKEMAVYFDELTDLEEELDSAKENAQVLSMENETLQYRCEKLYHDLQDALETRQENERKIENVQQEYEQLLSENNELKEYIEKAELDMDLCNTGKNVSDVQERQKRRKLKELKTGVERALWFAETYGLKVNLVSFLEENGNSHNLSFGEATKKKAYKDLPEEEKLKIKQILFIQDKFCVGEAAYHELTMAPAGEGLPRSYLIRQCKDTMDDLCHIERTPGKSEGAQVNFKNELSKVLKKHIRNKGETDITKLGKIKVKLSGDGAKMTRVTGFVILSFSILDGKESVMSYKANHTIAVIKGGESYELLYTSCSIIFNDVNKIIKDGFINIDGVNIEIDMCMGGDYKYLLLIMGMKGATSDYSCIWCKIHKPLRHDMNKPMDFYYGESSKRTLQDITDCALKKGFSCEFVPLLNIRLDNIVLDELHLMLRVTDKLTKNLIGEAINRDFKENLNKPTSEKSSAHLDNLISAICSCGVSFSVWQKPNADGSASGLHDFTSLMGSDKKLLLKKLSSKLDGVITPETSNTVIELWKDFNDIYTNLLQKEDPTDEDIKNYFTKVTAWIDLFTSLGGQLEGYCKKDVTPYMHAMVYHVPHFMKIHRGVKKFTGQGVEKLNDVCRKIHLVKSNKWDATKDVLLVGKRLENLGNLERTPRAYSKNDNDYWSSGISESRAKRQRLCDQEVTPPNAIPDLSPEIIKSRLKDMGIKTRIRNPKKLQELYRNSIMAANNKRHSVK